MDDLLRHRLQELGFDPDHLADPEQTWQILFARYGSRVTISDRYAIEAAVRGISPGEIPPGVKANLGMEVIESQFPGIELIGDPSRAPIVVVPYDGRWPAMYADWRNRLSAALPAASRLAHVGSTSVPGLAAKPIVDIQVSVPDLTEEITYVPAIESLGVPLRSRDSHHRYFRPPATQPRIVHIHVCEVGSRWERDHLLFRDFLRNHPNLCNSYGALKLRLAAEYHNDRLAYTDAKAGFILDAMDDAERWAQRTDWSLSGTD